MLLGMKTLTLILIALTVACGEASFAENYTTSQGIKVECESTRCYPQDDVETIIDLTLSEYLEVSPALPLDALGERFAVTTIKFMDDMEGKASPGATGSVWYEKDTATIYVKSIDIDVAYTSLAHEVIHFLNYIDGVPHTDKHPSPFFGEHSLENHVEEISRN